ncbi:protein of unknown function [Tepidibacter aestuarii]|nr:protein of unknown function [Tepidibacter aestuarii]
MNSVSKSILFFISREISAFTCANLILSEFRKHWNASLSSRHANSLQKPFIKNLLSTLYVK